MQTITINTHQDAIAKKTSTRFSQDPLCEERQVSGAHFCE